jgi:hypothetical protein
MNKKCQIVGFDGADECIETMAAAFYMNAGYDVQMGVRIPSPCDLLVILRGAVPVGLDFLDYSEVHLYGYAWRLDAIYTDLLKSVRHKLIIPHVSYLPDGYSDIHGDSNVIYSFPPVIPDFWYVENGSHDGSIVHVGNYKKNQSDQSVDGFVQNLRNNNVEVYGAGWEDVLPSSQLKGSLDMGKLSSVYSKSQLGVGIMYSFQRKFSFSGRFFQAPLAGLPLLTESIPLLSSCPGLHELDWRENIDFHTLPNFLSGVELAQSAYAYWRNQTLNLALRLDINLLNRLFPAKGFRSGRDFIQNFPFLKD